MTTRTTFTQNRSPLTGRFDTNLTEKQAEALRACFAAGYSIRRAAAAIPGVSFGAARRFRLREKRVAG